MPMNNQSIHSLKKSITSTIRAFSMVSKSGYRREVDRVFMPAIKSMETLNEQCRTTLMDINTAELNSLRKLREASAISFSPTVSPELSVSIDPPPSSLYMCDFETYMEVEALKYEMSGQDVQWLDTPEPSTMNFPHGDEGKADFRDGISSSR